MDGVWKTAKQLTSHFEERASTDYQMARCSDLLTFLQPTQFDIDYSVRGESWKMCTCSQGITESSPNEVSTL